MGSDQETPPEGVVGEAVGDILRAVELRIAQAEAEGQHIPSVVAGINDGFKQVAAESDMDGYPVIVIDEDNHSMSLDVRYTPRPGGAPFSPWPRTVALDDVCPRCGSDQIGGGVVDDMVPDWRCLVCDNTWARLVGDQRP